MEVPIVEKMIQPPGTGERMIHMMKYDLSAIMHRAWLTAKAADENACRIETAKAAAGISEEVKTWSGWREAGYEVIHGSKCLFGCDLIHGSKGDGAIYKARFFGASQVQAMA